MARVVRKKHAYRFIRLGLERPINPRPLVDLEGDYDIFVFPSFSRWELVSAFFFGSVQPWTCLTLVLLSDRTNCVSCFFRLVYCRRSWSSKSHLLQPQFELPRTSLLTVIVNRIWCILDRCQSLRKLLDGYKARQRTTRLPARDWRLRRQPSM